MSNILVTGGAGFIGSHLVRTLVEGGDCVKVLDNLSTGHASNLAGTGVELILGDIRDPGELQQAVEKADLVFHLAAMVSVPESMEDPRSCYEVNEVGTLNLLWAAHRAGVKRVVLSSSCAIYGNASQASTEDDPAMPLSPYAGSKWAAENTAATFHRVYGLSTINLRYFNVYGPGQRADSPYAAVIPLFIQAMLSGTPPTIYGDGHQTRDFVYVSDVVRANILAARAEEPEEDIFNIAGPTSISILDLYETLKRIIPGGKDVEFAPPREGDILHSRADRSRAETALGYRPEITLEQGLQHTVQWYASEGSKPNK